MLSEAATMQMYPEWQEEPPARKEYASGLGRDGSLAEHGREIASCAGSDGLHGSVSMCLPIPTVECLDELGQHSDL